MTTRDFKRNLVEVIKNNSNLECSDDDEVLFTNIDSIRVTKESGSKILVESGDRLFVITIDAFST